MSIVKNILSGALIPVCAGLLFSGCVELSNNHYSVDAYNSSGVLLNTNLALVAQGSRIYSVRNSLCRQYPQATIIIRDIKTKEELAGESPYQCR